MLLTYQLFSVDALHCGVRCFSLDLREGERWVGTPYPLRVDSILSGKIKGIRVAGLDGKILMSMQMHQKIRGDDCLFQGVDTSRLIELLLKSKRAYPMGKNPYPLTASDPKSRDLKWGITESSFVPTLELSQGEQLLPGKPCYLLNPETGSCAPLASNFPDTALWKWVTAPPQNDLQAVSFWKALSDAFPESAFPHPPKMVVEKMDNIRPVPLMKMVESDAATQVPESLKLSFTYGALPVQPDATGKVIRWMEAGKIMEAERNLDLEKTLLKEIQSRGLEPYKILSDNLFAATLPEPRYMFDPTRYRNWADFITANFTELEKAGWRMDLPLCYQPRLVDEQDWYTDFHDAGTGTLRYEHGILIDGKRVNLLPVLYGFLKERRQKTLSEILEEIGEDTFPFPTEQGLLLIHAKRFQEMVKSLFELFGDGVLDRDQCLRISPWRATELYQEESEGWKPPQELSMAMDALRGGVEISPLEPSADFKGELRDYQKQGLGWIDFLAQARLGGILADDMGLGKTVQVIAAFLRLRELSTKPCKFLVVSPASVLPNWRAELRKFSPSLSVHSHHGSGRHLVATAMDECEVLLTTYGTLVRDEVAFRAISFTAVVLDEAQAIKNSKTKVSKMVGGLRADLRLALSGTPLENHLGELRSLFQFALPGYLGTEKLFNAVIRHPIEKEDSTRAKELLYRKISPLLLRRSKDVVAGELPPKTEIIQELPLTSTQADLYEVVRASGEIDIQETLEGKGFERSQIQVLDLLMKLRQVCCDPRLCKNVTRKTTAEDSSKLQWLREVLPEMIEEGRRILLFSQFTSMLDLIKTEVDKLKIPYVEIRGSTRDREAPVKKFQQGKTPLFLISLKAGGTGLNLTAADTVIFFDPWWNPAMEAQAADRAHRIGQDKPVFVYKLICAGTVESRILDLQERKKGLQELLNEDACSTTKKFTEADFHSLMAPLSLEP